MHVWGETPRAPGAFMELRGKPWLLDPRPWGGAHSPPPPHRCAWPSSFTGVVMCLDSGSSRVGLNPSSILFKLCDLGLNLSLLLFLIYQMGITIDSS